METSSCLHADHTMDCLFALKRVQSCPDLFINADETDFYEAAFQRLIAMPENEDLYRAYKERNELYVKGAR